MQEKEFFNFENLPPCLTTIYYSFMKKTATTIPTNLGSEIAFEVPYHMVKTASLNFEIYICKNLLKLLFLP